MHKETPTQTMPSLSWLSMASLVFDWLSLVTGVVGSGGKVNSDEKTEGRKHNEKQRKECAHACVCAARVCVCVHDSFVFGWHHHDIMLSTVTKFHKRRIQRNRKLRADLIALQYLKGSLHKRKTQWNRKLRADLIALQSSKRSSPSEALAGCFCCSLCGFDLVLKKEARTSALTLLEVRLQSVL